jgi:hypothetical protein
VSRTPKSNPLKLALEFLLAEGGTVQYTRRDDAAAHAALAARLPAPVSGTVEVRVQHLADLDAIPSTGEPPRGD